MVDITNHSTATQIPLTISRILCQLRDLHWDKYHEVHLLFAELSNQLYVLSDNSIQQTKLARNRKVFLFGFITLLEGLRKSLEVL